MKPSNTDISDLLNGIQDFVQSNPDWPDDEAKVARLAMAYMMFTKMCGPEDVTDEEYEFVMSIYDTLQEIGSND